jgi:hypothetical protein
MQEESHTRQLVASKNGADGPKTTAAAGRRKTDQTDEVYTLWHTEPETDDSRGHEFLVGLQLPGEAESAMQRSATSPGFRALDGFEIHEMRFDLD